MSPSQKHREYVDAPAHIEHGLGTAITQYAGPPLPASSCRFAMETSFPWLVHLSWGLWVLLHAE